MYHGKSTVDVQLMFSLLEQTFTIAISLALITSKLLEAKYPSISEHVFPYCNQGNQFILSKDVQHEKRFPPS